MMSYPDRSMPKFSSSHDSASVARPVYVRTGLFLISIASQHRMLWPFRSRISSPSVSMEYSFAYPPRYWLEDHSLAISRDSVQ